MNSASAAGRSIEIWRKFKNKAILLNNLTVDLMDGRPISVPLAWYPRLMNATPTQRQRWEVSGAG